MTKREIFTLWAAATAAGAITFATPAAAVPVNGNSGNPAESIFNLFNDGEPGCWVTDGAGTSSWDPECITHNALKTNLDGKPVVSMYWDNGELPEGAELPTSTITNSFSFYYAPAAGWVLCTEVIRPSGQYGSRCYFNEQTQGVRTP